MNEKKYPKFVVGSFIFNDKGELFLRTTPSQDNKFTCVNANVEWGDTIDQTLKSSVKDKTGLEVVSYQLIGLTDGLNIATSNNPEPINMIFADYKVLISDANDFQSNDDSREYKWLTPEEWLALGKDAFGPYIYDVLKGLTTLLRS